MTTPDDILAFWFPAGLDADEEIHRRQFELWFGGGADWAIVDQYQPVLGAACRGELDHWADVPRARLALIIVLDQVLRTVYRDTSLALRRAARRSASRSMASSGGTTRSWQPCGRRPSSCSRSDTLSRSRSSNVRLALPSAGRRGARASAEGLCVFGIPARGHRDVIARFCRHPHNPGVVQGTNPGADVVKGVTSLDWAAYPIAVYEGKPADGFA